MVRQALIDSLIQLNKTFFDSLLTETWKGWYYNFLSVQINVLTILFGSNHLLVEFFSMFNPFPRCLSIIISFNSFFSSIRFSYISIS